MSKVWSSGDSQGRGSGPAFWANEIRPRNVTRRSGAARPSFARRNENPSWGDPPPRSALREAVDFVLFAGVFVGVALLALHVAMGRA